jgi:hypothetical protein
MGRIVTSVTIQNASDSEFPPTFGEVLFVDLAPEDGRYEPLVGYLPLEHSQATVDMLGHRLIHVKRMDLKELDRRRDSDEERLPLDEETIARIADESFLEYDAREADQANQAGESDRPARPQNEMNDNE